MAEWLIGAIVVVMLVLVASDYISGREAPHAEEVGLGDLGVHVAREANTWTQEYLHSEFFRVLGDSEHVNGEVQFEVYCLHLFVAANTLAKTYQGLGSVWEDLRAQIMQEAPEVAASMAADEENAGCAKAELTDVITARLNEYEDVIQDSESAMQASWGLGATTARYITEDDYVPGKLTAILAVAAEQAASKAQTVLLKGAATSNSS